MRPVPTKLCTGPCKKRLPADAEHFYKKADSIDGLRHKCKECYKAERRKPKPPLV